MPFIIFTYCLVKAEKGNFNFKNEFSRIEELYIFYSSVLVDTEHSKSMGHRHFCITDSTDGIACINTAPPRINFVVMVDLSSLSFNIS